MFILSPVCSSCPAQSLRPHDLGKDIYKKDRNILSSASADMQHYALLQIVLDKKGKEVVPDKKSILQLWPRQFQVFASSDRRT